MYELPLDPHDAPWTDEAQEVAEAIRQYREMLMEDRIAELEDYYS